MTFDFRSRFGISLDEVGHSISFGEAKHLVDELARDQSSHFFASLAGWSYPMGRSESYLGALLTRVMNVTAADDAKPFSLDWPWPDKTVVEEVTDEERNKLKALLEASSAFPEVRSA